MENARSQHPSLNFFTTDQLVSLSKDFAQVIGSKKKHFGQSSVMMLKLIAPNLTSTELQKFVKRMILSTEVYAADDEMMEEDIEDQSDENRFAHFKASKIYIDLRKNFDEATAIAAILENMEAFENDETDALEEWCMDHDDEDEECAKILSAYKKPTPRKVEMEPTKNESMEIDDQPTISDVFTFEDKSATLAKKLDAVWNNFLTYVDKLNIDDFVSFQVVANVLDELSKASNFHPNRQMLQTLNVGKPNLIVCPDKEIHSTCLSIYASSDHLPSVDEVLMCTPNTSLEQIELICRRAFHDETGKIYCVLHAENIDYDKSVHIEKTIMESTVTNHNYRLVFLTGKESNDRSYITTALDQYKRAMPEIATKESLQEFCFKMLRSFKQPMDPDGCRGRVVVSKEAGCGKSLVIRNLTKVFF